MIRFQRTIKNTFSCEGIGLHTGSHVKMRVKSGSVNTGIIFIRTDLGCREIPAVAANTASTAYATTLSCNGASVQTVEHLMAAFFGLNIDNAIVEINGPEIPIMDGSAGPFAKLIASAGINTQEELQPMIKILNPIFVREGNKQIALWPSDSPGISYFIDFNHPMLKEQSLHYLQSEDAFLREVADARTFGFLNEVKALQANGLAKGASLENAVALGDNAVLNKEGLRYNDEFVRHKILDLIGDFSLVGMPIIGHIVAHKSGHALNAMMVAKLLENPQNWMVTGNSKKKPVQQHEMLYQHATV